MSVTRKQAGAQSATFLVTVENANLGVAEWAALPTGKLKDLLNTAYLTEAGDVDNAAFVAAFATAGGLHTGMQIGTENTECGIWSLKADAPNKGSPVYTVDVGEGADTVVRISVSYSASE